MRRIACVDCETDPFKKGLFVRPFIWGVYFNDTYRHFKTFEQVLNWLSSFNEKIVCYAHNGGRFDYLFKGVVEQIPDYQVLKIIHGRLAQFKIGEIEFRDSLSAIPVALAEFKKDDIAYWKMKKEHRAKYMPEIIKYLETDVKSLHELISEFVRDYGPCLTLAGASLKAACKIEDFLSPKSTPAYFRDLKPFYYGGRVQAFSKGKVKGPVYMWDINSAYPYAMTMRHPWGGRYHLSEYRGGRIAEQSFIEIECEAHGAFPSGEIKFSTRFPDDGKRRTFKVTGWEYNAAKDLKLLGKNPKIIQVYSFPETRSFKSYVNHFYKLRMESPDGSAKRIFGKLFMNSLYGRMGMDGSTYEQYCIAPLKAARKLEKDGWSMIEETVDERGIYARPEPKERWRFHDIAVAASVTGCVRAMDLRAMMACKRAGSKVHYLDTDGLMTTGNWKPKQSKKLGDWKLEGVGPYGFFAGKKMYAVRLYKKWWKRDKKTKKMKKWKKAHKGAVLTGEQIARVSEGDEIMYYKESPSMGILTGEKFIKRKIRATG